MLSLVYMVEKFGAWLLKSARILEIWCPNSEVWSPKSVAVAALASPCTGLQKQAVQKNTCGISSVENPGCCPDYAKP